jgi:hypothetical protein
MSPATVLSVTAALLILTAAEGTALPRDAKRLAESIPPNCTLDPFTGKEVCHIWPSCTMDPFTGKMNCPVPPKKAVMRRQAV